MIERGRLLGWDPFGAQGNYWLAYSWVPEIAYAFVYRLFGFRGLQVLQLLQTMAGVAILFFAARGIALTVALRKEGGTKRDRDFGLAISMLLVVLFTAPIWYLRPQFLSLVFFGLALWLAVRQASIIPWLAPFILLSILWVNVHIFWIFLPGVVFIFRVLGRFSHTPSAARAENPLANKQYEKSGLGPKVWAKELGCGVVAAAVVAGCGLINPYGWRVFTEALKFGVAHQAVYRGVIECQRLSPALGYLFWLYVAAALILVWRWRVYFRTSPGLFVLSLAFAGFALLNLRFLPFFGLVAAFLSGSEVSLDMGANQPVQHLRRLELLAIILFGAACVICLEIPEPLSPRRQALFTIAKRMTAEYGARNTRVLNHFDDGGWLELALFTNRSTKGETSLKPVVDGRTGVIGDQRFAEFEKVAELSDGWCRIVELWGAELAVLPEEMLLAKALLSGEAKGEQCQHNWVMKFRTAPFAVLEKVKRVDLDKGSDGSK